MKRYTKDGLCVIQEETIDVFNRDAARTRESIDNLTAVKQILRKIEKENSALYTWCSQYLDYVKQLDLSDTEKDRMATGFTNGIVHFYEFFRRQTSANKLEKTYGKIFERMLVPK